MSGVNVDAVAAELVERLRDLIGEHTETSALRADMAAAGFVGTEPD